MDLAESDIEELEAALTELAELDPAELPEPAARLADILGRLLEETDPERPS